MPASPPSRPDHQRLLGATVLWLLAGSALLLSTLVPWHTAWLGWTPAFWLFGAPLTVLLGLEPQLPRRLLGSSRARRPARDGLAWHGTPRRAATSRWR